MRVNKKRKNWKAQEKRQEKARIRQVDYDLLSARQKIDIAKKRRGKSKHQLARLFKERDNNEAKGKQEGSY